MVGPMQRLPPDQLAEFAEIVETRSDRQVDGVVYWRRADLDGVIVEWFGVDHERYVGKRLRHP